MDKSATSFKPSDGNSVHYRYEMAAVQFDLIAHFLLCAFLLSLSLIFSVNKLKTNSKQNEL